MLFKKNGQKCQHSILFAFQNCHHEKIDANYHIPLLDLKSGVGRSRAGKNRIFPLIVRRAVIQSKKEIGQSDFNNKGAIGGLIGYRQDAQFSLEECQTSPDGFAVSSVQYRVKRIEDRANTICIS
jgi:hypothetical protein